jgi:hypothetical protein
MTNDNLEKLRYPIGKWKQPEHYNSDSIQKQISIITEFPEKLQKKISGWTITQLDTPYRPEGWTARQVVHHCADSHMNAFIRFKLALTENKPTIKPYAEALWAELPDAKIFPVNISIQLLEALHARWTILLNSLNEEQWKRGFIHPEHNGELKLFLALSLYAWHCEHHYAHVELVEKKS